MSQKLCCVQPSFKKTETIESTDDYLAIICSSKKSATPFMVQECAVCDFEKYVKIRKPRNLLISKSVILPYDRHGNVTSHQNYSLMTTDVRLSHLSKKKLVTIPPAPGVAIAAAAKRDDVLSLIRCVCETSSFIGSISAMLLLDSVQVQMTETVLTLKKTDDFVQCA